MKAKIIEDNKKNVQMDTMGITLIEQQKIPYFQDTLSQLYQTRVYIHNLQIMTLDKGYYNDIKDIEPAPQNRAKIHGPRIGRSQNTPNVN